MRDKNEPLVDLAGAVLDGTPVHWPTLESTTDDATRATVRELKVLAEIAEVYRRDPVIPNTQEMGARAPELHPEQLKQWGHLKILEFVGSGSFGDVYRAWNTRLDREVALKLLHPSSEQQDSEESSVIHEGRLLARVQHPNVAVIYDADRLDGRVGLWMEFVHGRTLEQMLREGHSFDEAEVIRIGADMCRALAAVHGAELLHRDVKAQNVMLADSGRPVLMDFGTGRALDTQPSKARATAGTPLYIAPEIFAGHEPTAQSDIYSIGVLLYHLLTNSYPVSGATVSELRKAHARAERTDIRAGCPGISDKLARVIERALEPEPERRFARAESMAAALETLGPGKEQAPFGRIVRPHWLAIALSAMAVALWVFRGGGAGMYSENPARTGQLTGVPFTNYAGIECQPTFSPDGKAVAFAWRSEDPNSYFQIYRKEIGSNEGPIPLTRDPVNHFAPAWSPDGSCIAYVTGVPDEPFKICRIPAPGGPEQVVGTGGAWRQIAFRYSGSKLAWTPDGKWLVVPEFEQGKHGLFLLSVETGGKRKLTAPPADSEDFDPAPSPEGHTLTFVRGNTSIRDVFLLQLTDDFQARGEPQRLTFEDRDVQSPVWTPAGDEIVFSSGPWLGERHLLRVPIKPVNSAAQYRPVQMIFGEGASNLTLSNANHRLVYTKEFFNCNLYKFAVTGKTVMAPEKLIVSSGMNYLPDFSPDGRRIAFVSTRSGSEEIWICDSDGRSNLRQLTNMEGSLTSFPRWSPDGSRILFHSMRAGSQDLYVIDTRGGTPQRIISDPAIDVEASWSHDGRWIYFESSRSGSFQVHRVPTSGGDAVQLTHEGGFTPMESRDGRWVFYFKGTGLWRVPVESGTEALVIDKIGSQLCYTVAESGVYFLDWSRAGNVDLKFFDFATRNVSVLLDTNNQRAPEPIGIAISPDRRSIAFSRWDRFDSDLILVEDVK